MPHKDTEFYSKPGALILALGDTVFFEASRLGSFISACIAFGADVEAEQYRPFVGLSQEGTIELGKKVFGADFRIEEVWDTHVKAYEQRRELYGVNLREGVERLIDYANANRIKLGICTNIRREVTVSMLQSVGLWEKADKLLFDAVVCSDDDGVDGRAKPLPFMHRRACALLNVSPSAAIAVEDCDSGVEAALAAYLRAVHIPGTRYPGLDFGGKTTNGAMSRMLPSLLKLVEKLEGAK